MTVQTQILNAGHLVKLGQRKVESEDCEPHWVLEIVVEDARGEPLHILELWSEGRPLQMFRVTDRSYMNMRKPAVALMEAGMLVRQVDSLSPVVMSPLPVEGCEDYQVPAVYGHPGIGKTCINDQTQVELDEIAHNPNK
jgi:hypothetical protein